MRRRGGRGWATVARVTSTLFAFLRGAVARPNGGAVALLEPEPWQAALLHEWAAGWARALAELAPSDLRALGAAAVAYAAPGLTPAGAAAWRAWRAGLEADDAWRDEPPEVAPPRRWEAPGGRWAAAPASVFLPPLLALSRAPRGAAEAPLATLLRLAVRGVPGAGGAAPPGGHLANALGAAAAFLAAYLDALAGRRTAPELLAAPAFADPPVPVPEAWALDATSGAAPSRDYLRRFGEAASQSDPAWAEALATPLKWAARDDRGASEFASEVVIASALAAGGRRGDLALAAAGLAVAWRRVAPLSLGEGERVALAVFGPGQTSRALAELRADFRDCLASALTALARTAPVGADARAWAASALDLHPPAPSADRGPGVPVRVNPAAARR